jgi:hypothetical protein
MWLIDVCTKRFNTEGAERGEFWPKCSRPSKRPQLHGTPRKFPFPRAHAIFQGSGCFALTTLKSNATHDSVLFKLPDLERSKCPSIK